MFVRLLSATPTTDKSADITAIAAALAGLPVQTLLELAHVQHYEELGDVGVETDAAIASKLADWEPWASMDTPTREATVNARRTTLNGLRTI